MECCGFKFGMQWRLVIKCWTMYWKLINFWWTSEGYKNVNTNDTQVQQGGGGPKLNQWNLCSTDMSSLWGRFQTPKIYRKHNAYWSFKNSTAKKLMWKHPNCEAYRSIPLMCPTCPDLCSLVKHVKYMLCPEKSCCYMRVCRNGSVWIFAQGMFSIILLNTFRYSFNILEINSKNFARNSKKTHFTRPHFEGFKTVIRTLNMEFFASYQL